MKFSKTLASHLTPEWRPQYLRYEDLKEKLYEARKIADATIDPEEYLDNIDLDFFEDCEEQLKNINSFFNLKMAEAIQKFLELRRKYEAFSKLIWQDKATRKELRSFNKKELKLAFLEYYYSLVLLQNFQSLNYTGFRKILKKHDKIFRRDNGREWFEFFVEPSDIKKQKGEINELIQRTEDIYTELEDGDRSQAMKKLRVPPLGEMEKPSTMLSLGIGIGELTVLFVVLIITIICKSTSPLEIAACKYLYRPVFFLFFYMFFVSINVLGWRNFGVNHILIFEINPRDHLTGCDLMRVAIFIGVLWSLSLLGFLYSEWLLVPALAFPLALALLLLLFLFNPMNFCHRSARIWLLVVTSRVFIAPFVEVKFADFWLGDQLISLSKIFHDSFVCLCFYLRNWNVKKLHIDPKNSVPYDELVSPLIYALPVWFRFAQCLRRYRDVRKIHPFLTNAAKYASMFPVFILFSTFQYSKVRVFYRNTDNYQNISSNPWFWIYISMRICSTCYVYFWDIVLDFGLMKNIKARRHWLLRDEMVYPAFSYYAVIITNLILRFFWILELVMVEKDFMTSYVGETMNGCLEIFRRYLWNYYRLENEHLNNCGLFRAVRDISINIMVPMYEAKSVDTIADAASNIS